MSTPTPAPLKGFDPAVEFHPSNMPFELHRDLAWLDRTLSQLPIYDLVDIHRECRVVAGEDEGQWEILLEHGHKQVTTRDRSLCRSLWSATRQMAHEMDAEAKAVQAEIAAAKAKLTPRERQLLRVNS